jgi:hypothetical protein
VWYHFFGLCPAAFSARALAPSEERLIPCARKFVLRFAEVVRELSDGVQVKAYSGGRVVEDLQILQHALAKCGHKKARFVLTTPQIASRSQSWVMSWLGPPEA